MTTNALLSFAVALLLVGPISALAKAGSCFGEASDMTVYPSTRPANNGTSHHTLVFTGDEWEKVKGREGKKLDAALLHDVYEQLLRTHAFNTAVSIDDIDVGNGLEVTLTVVQEPLLSGPEQKLQHMWNPHEVSSLIMQGSFNLTKKLYKKHDFSLGSVRLPIMNGNIYNCGKTCSFLRTVVTLLSLVMAAVIGTTVCFRRKWAREAKKHQDSLAVKAAIDVLGADDDGTQLPGAGDVVIITANDEEEEALPIPTAMMPLVSNARDGKGVLMHSQVPVPNVLYVDEDQGKALAYPHMLAPNVLSVDENQGKALAYPHMLAPNVLSVDENQGKALPYPHMQALNAPTFAYRRPIGLLSPLAVPRATKKSLRGMAPLPPIAMPNVLRGEYATAALRTPLIAPVGAYTREEELMPLPSVAMPAAPNTKVEKPAAVAPLMDPAGAYTREEELMPLPSVAMPAAPSTEVEKPAAVAPLMDPAGAYTREEELMPLPSVAMPAAPSTEVEKPAAVAPLMDPAGAYTREEELMPLPSVAMPGAPSTEVEKPAAVAPLMDPAGAYTREEELMPLPSVAMPAAPSTEVEKPAAVAPLMDPAGAYTREEELMPLPSVAMPAAPSTEVEKPAAVAASSTNNVLNTGSDQVVMLPPDEW